MLYIKGRPLARSSYGQQDSTEHGSTVAKAYTTYYSQPQVDGVNTYVFPTPFSLTKTTPHHTRMISGTADLQYCTDLRNFT